MHALLKTERKNIFSLFIQKPRLTFTEIEKSLGLRSNYVAYHLKQLINEGLIEKQGDLYRISIQGERFIPKLNSLSGLANKDNWQNHSPLPVVLLAVTFEDKVLLQQRKEKPYLGYWGLLGGRIRLHETIYETALRLAKEKGGLETNITSLQPKLCHVLHEHVFEINHQGDKQLAQSFLLFFMKLELNKTGFDNWQLQHASLKNSVLNNALSEKTTFAQPSKYSIANFFHLNNLPDGILSDYWLLQHKLTATTTYSNVEMIQEKERLTNIIIPKNK